MAALSAFFECPAIGKIGDGVVAGRMVLTGLHDPVLGQLHFVHLLAGDTQAPFVQDAPGQRQAGPQSPAGLAPGGVYHVDTSRLERRIHHGCMKRFAVHQGDHPEQPCSTSRCTCEHWHGKASSRFSVATT